MPSVQRLPITEIGQVEPDSSALGIIAHGWHFGAPWLPEGAEVPVSDGNLGGWTAMELHTIAHGAPCDCPIGRDHAERGWLG